MTDKIKTRLMSKSNIYNIILKNLYSPRNFTIARTQTTIPTFKVIFNAKH